MMLPMAPIKQHVRRITTLALCSLPPGPPIEPEPRGNDNSSDLGVGVLALSAALVPILLAAVVAATLGMGAGSLDNGGLGVPLSVEESRVLGARAGQQTSPEEEERRLAQGLSIEEAREEEALVRILRSEPLRSS